MERFARPARLILPPGLFRLALAYVVFVNHTIPVHLGTASVYLFFMLSGYWIYRMWDREYATTNSPYLIFLVSRAWRLLPVYYATLAIFCALAAAFSFDPQVPRGFGGRALHFYLSHALLLGYAPLPFGDRLILPVWSLDIELQFYLAAPPLIFLLRHTRAWSPWRLLLYAVATVGFLVFVARYTGIWAQSAWLPMYLAFFLIGLLTAHDDWRPAPALAVGLAAVAAAAALACIALPATRGLLIEGSFSSRLSDFNPDANIVLALLLAPYAMATVRRAPASPWLRRIDRDCGNLTYEIYLLHWSVAMLLIRLGHGASTYARLPFIVASWLLILPVAWGIYVWLDRPLDRMRVAFVRSRQASRA
jgi:peptidoglycan/LPS O-acetylase OafA/YrhL